MERESLILSISGGRSAPRRCRAALAALNGSLGDLRQSVELLVTELVANAVLHGPAGKESQVEVSLTAVSEHVRVEVSDPGTGFTPPAQLPEPGAEGKFGLTLVDRIARRWGVEGATVWAEIDRGSDFVAPANR